jgi:hypothetical protein
MSDCHPWCSKRVFSFLLDREIVLLEQTAASECRDKAFQDGFSYATHI